MERRNELTSLPRSSNVDSGVEINTFLSSTSQLAPDEDRQVVEQYDVEGAVANDVVHVIAVQESQDTEDDIHLHPAGTVIFHAFGVIFHAFEDQISVLSYGDIDIQMAKALLETFRQLLVDVAKCRTCFVNRRGVVNFPCTCFSNCQECAGEMFLCSMCGSRIDCTRPAVLQYVGVV